MVRTPYWYCIFEAIVSTLLFDIFLNIEVLSLEPRKPLFASMYSHLCRHYFFFSTQGKFPAPTLSSLTCRESAVIAPICIHVLSKEGAVLVGPACSLARPCVFFKKCIHLSEQNFHRVRGIPLQRLSFFPFILC